MKLSVGVSCRKGTISIRSLLSAESKRVDLKALANLLGCRKLSFAKEDDLRSILGVAAGAVTVLGVVNDTEWRAELIIDSAIWTDESLHCRPLVNTRTLLIRPRDLEKLFRTTGHAWRLLDVPAR